MNRIKICKFGGTSVAKKEGLKNISEILKDNSRKIVVFSAPGKRFKEDTKVTDLLISAHCTHSLLNKNLKLMQDRFEEICKILSINYDIKKEISKIKLHYFFSKNKSYLFSRGEYLMGKILSKHLGLKFIDSTKLIKFTLDGKIKPSTYAKIKKAQEKYDRFITPGFYGTNPFGKIKVMSRGGSDITGAICTKAIEDSVYENWTDVDGVFLSQQDIEKHKPPVSEINYNDIKFLSKYGTSVLHHKCPDLLKGHTTIIKNTFNPSSPGTRISENNIELNAKTTLSAYEITFKENKHISKLLKKSKIEKIYTYSIDGLSHLGFCIHPGYSNIKTFQKLKDLSLTCSNIKVSARTNTETSKTKILDTNKSIEIERM